MSIKFLCPHCKKVLSVKDHFAGKKAKCPKCDKVLTVPAPAPAAAQPAETPAAPPPSQAVQPSTPPPTPAELEAAAAAALADEPKAEAPPPTTIDFNCPMCDAELHLPLELGGKREPCPECKRIIKVPEAAVKDPTDWRRVNQSLPSGAKRVEEKAPEGAWGSAGPAASVNLGTLREAGVLPQAKELLTVRQKIVRYTAIAGCAVLLLVGGIFGYLKWLDVGKGQAARLALEYAESDQGKKELGRDDRAAVYRLAGEYFLGVRQSGCAENAGKQFGKSLAALREASDPSASATEHDALLQDLALAEVELGGTQEEADAGLKLKWDDVQKELHAVLADMHYSEPRMETLRDLARRLAVKGEGKRATALASSLYSTPNVERAEALAEVGLELETAKKSDLAEAAAGQVMQMYPAAAPGGKVENNRPALAPAAVALAIARKKEPPTPAKKGEPWAAEDEVSDPLGQAEGLARLGQWKEAQDKIPSIQTPDGRLRASVAIAEAAREDKVQSKSTAEDAIKAALAWTAPQPPSSWLLLRLARVGEQAGVSPESLQALAAAVSDRDLRGRAQLAAVRAQLAPGKQADLKVMDGIEQGTVSARLVRELVARRNAGPVSLIKSWDPPNRAFGFLGFALSAQSSE